MLTPSDRSSLSRLHLEAKQIVEGFYSGLHRSPHKGFSVEFKEHRPYAQGDDIRTIDWKLYGKTDRFYIREFEEETNLKATLVVDASGSMGYRGSRAELTKHEYASRTAAALAYLLLRQQDSVGLATFDQSLRAYVPPRSRPRHLTPILAELEARAPGGETKLAAALQQVALKVGRRGLVVLLSDLFGEVEPLLRALTQFRHAGHEVVALQILDPDELDFPFREWTRFQSLETADHRHLVDPSQMRTMYLDRLRAFQSALAQGCSRQRVALVPMTTDQPPADALATFLAMRRRSP